MQRFGLTEQAWPLRERAYVLYIDALCSLGRRDEAKTVALEYLALLPQTASSMRIRGLVSPLARPRARFDQSVH